MNRLSRILLLAGVGGLLSLGTTVLKAQPGNFDPEQFRQRMMERYRERLEVKSDDEWKIIEPRINAVLEARREVGVGGFGGFGRGRGQRAGGDAEGGRQGRRGGFGPEPSAEQQALERAIESNASSEELKAKLAEFRKARKEKEAKLEKAQAELQAVLSVKQEANAVLMGLLP
jgi:hypothetical protein